MPTLRCSTTIRDTYTDGRLTGLNPGSDYGVSYGYDSYGRVETINAQVAGTGAQTYTYGYLPDSNLLESLTTSHGLTVTRSYEPNRDVLTQVQNQFGTDVISQYDYISDELAQRTSMTTSGTAFDSAPQPTVSPDTSTYTTNALNQYTSLQYSVSSIQLTYDLDGNLIEDNIHHFTYDAENRLISVIPITPTTGSMKVEYAYDYISRRTQKQVSTYDGSSWVLETAKSFTYDGWNLIREQTTQGSQTTTEYYVWGLDVSGSLQGAGGIGGLLSTTNSLTSTTFLYTFDANGNVGQLVDASNGTIAAHYEYDPFGKLLVVTGSEAEGNSFRFSTKYYDVETGLYYYGYRYYDPVLGRWWTRDPIEEGGGLNLYGFVGNTPIDSVDKDGRSEICAAMWGTHAVKKDKTMLENLRCAKEALQLAMTTFRDQFPDYNPLVNGNKALHCLGNCMLVKRCGFSKADFQRLMEANKTYEMCTAGPPDFERCTDWCADTDGYTEDVFTDFQADAVGLCAGFAGKDCNEACKEARMTKLDPEIGPQQPRCEPTCEQVTSCIEQETSNPTTVQAIVDAQYEKFTSTYPEISYEGVCNNLP